MFPRSGDLRSLYILSYVAIYLNYDITTYHFYTKLEIFEKQV
nr:hypothetical protein BN993_00352 [Virgibacillus halodenitrificans]